MTPPEHIRSRDNPLLLRLRKLNRDPAGYRRAGQIWLEGEHLCQALLAHQQRPTLAVLTETDWAKPALRQYC